MRGRRPEKLTIARRDADALHTAAHCGSLPWFQVQRAKIVLAIAAGERQCSIAARLECDEATVWRACERYRQDGLGSLFADGRQGNSSHPQQISPVQRAQIVELACLEPIGNRSHPESGCILNRLPGNPWHFSVNPCSIVNASCAEFLISLTVVNYRSYKVFINMSV